MWMPDFTGEYPIVKRLGLIGFVYLTITFTLKKIWTLTKVTFETDLKLKRILSILIGIALFGLAYEESFAKYHVYNDQQILTRDGYEDVGNDVVAPGPNRGSILIRIILGVFFIWSGISKRDEPSEEKRNWDV
jgi:hypothetical protein